MATTISKQASSHHRLKYVLMDFLLNNNNNNNTLANNNAKLLRWSKFLNIHYNLYRRTSWPPIRSVEIAENGKIYKSARENDHAITPHAG